MTGAEERPRRRAALGCLSETLRRLESLGEINFSVAPLTGSRVAAADTGSRTRPCSPCRGRTGACLLVIGQRAEYTDTAVNVLQFRQCAKCMHTSNAAATYK